MANCVLRCLEDGADLLARLAGIGSITSSRMARPLVGALGLHQALEVLLHLSVTLVLSADELRALLDLIAGDRLVVDEHRDGLLACDGLGLLFGLGRGAAAGRGLARACSGPERSGAATATATAAGRSTARRERAAGGDVSMAPVGAYP